MFNDYKDKTVLITGGTKGIGLATGLVFAQAGAHCILTYKWGNDDLSRVRKEFVAKNYKAPLLVQSDVAAEEDVCNLLNEIKKHHKKIDVFISNVSFALLTKSLNDYSLRGLLRSIEYSSWPIVAVTKKIHEIFHTYPRYIVGMSSHGPDLYFTNYDFVAAAKSLMETLIKYMNYRLLNDDVIINVVRARFTKTTSLRATFGKEYEQFGDKYNIADLFIEPSEIANSIFALCSGLMDGVRGQVVNVDKGTVFSDSVMSLYDKSKDAKNVRSK